MKSEPVWNEKADAGRQVIKVYQEDVSSSPLISACCRLSCSIGLEKSFWRQIHGLQSQLRQTSDG